MSTLPKEWLDKIAAFKKNDADINDIVPGTNSNLLEHAAWAGDLASLTTLISAGADVNHYDNRNKTALTYARESTDSSHAEKLAVIEELFKAPGLDSGDVIANIRGAMIKGGADNTEIMLKLAKGLPKSDPNIDMIVKGEVHKSSILEHAAWNGNTELVKILLDKGANPNHHELLKQKTALDFAIENNQIDVEKILASSDAIKASDVISRLVRAIDAEKTNHIKALAEGLAHHNDKYDLKDVTAEQAYQLFKHAADHEMLQHLTILHKHFDLDGKNHHYDAGHKICELAKEYATTYSDTQIVNAVGDMMKLGVHSDL